MPPEYYEGAIIHSSSLIGLKWNWMYNGGRWGMSAHLGLSDQHPANVHNA